MVKAKDIINIKDSIIKYKAALDKDTDSIQKFKIKNKIREQQYELMDVEIQLLNIEIDLYKDAKLHKQIFMDRYINRLTENQLINKYNMPRTSLYKLLRITKAIFEGNKSII